MVVVYSRSLLFDCSHDEQDGPNEVVSSKGETGYFVRLLFSVAANVIFRFSCFRIRATPRQTCLPTSERNARTPCAPSSERYARTYVLQTSLSPGAPETKQNNAPQLTRSYLSAPPDTEHVAPGQMVQGLPEGLCIMD